MGTNQRALCHFGEDILTGNEVIMSFHNRINKLIKQDDYYVLYHSDSMDFTGRYVVMSSFSEQLQYCTSVHFGDVSNVYRQNASTKDSCLL